MPKSTLATSTLKKEVKYTPLLTIPVGSTMWQHVEFPLSDLGMTSNSIVISVLSTNTLSSVCEIAGYAMSATSLFLTLARDCTVADGKVRVAFI